MDLPARAMGRLRSRLKPPNHYPPTPGLRQDYLCLHSSPSPSQRLQSPGVGEV